MEHQDDSLVHRTISRRHLLQVIIASGGAVTTSLLVPDQWASPFIEVGVLPAHAQASAMPVATTAPSATSSGPAPAPTLTPTATAAPPSPTLTPTPGPSATPTQTPTPSATPLPTQTPTQTLTPSATPSPTLTLTPTPTPTPEPTIYVMLCDSLPGGGQIRGFIDEVAADIDLYSGTGPLRNIAVTVTCNELPGSAFSPTLPQTARTDIKGRARFGHVDITAPAGTKFFLYFTATDPVNGDPLACMCGEYELLA